MNCRVLQSCSLVMERPGPSSPEILSPENFSPVSCKVLDGRDGLLGCLDPTIVISKVHGVMDTCQRTKYDTEYTSDSKCQTCSSLEIFGLNTSINHIYPNTRP